MKSLLRFACGFGAIFATFSCQETINKKDPFKIGQAIHEGFSKNDSLLLDEIFKPDTYKWSSEDIEQAQKFLSNNPELEILKMDTLSYTIPRGKSNLIDIYYKKGKDFYRLLSTYDPDSTGIIAIRSIQFEHLNKNCEENKQKPYVPSYFINFKSLIWTTSYDAKTLKSGVVELQNDMENDIDYIKFRIILKDKKSYGSNTFFNQTVESNKTIYSGDLARINIPAMEDFYVGFPVEKENLQWESELLEVRPKPESFDCQKIEELKSQVMEQA